MALKKLTHWGGKWPNNFDKLNSKLMTENVRFCDHKTHTQSISLKGDKKRKEKKIL